MIKCIKCNEVSGIKKAGMLRQKQRYYCRHCVTYFTIVPASEITDKNKSIPTIKDIAKAVGFSISTVSKALSNYPDVGKEKRELILAKATELNYQPNSLASGLRKKKTMNLGLIVPEFTHSYYPNIILEINKHLSLKGYTLIITQSNDCYQNEIKNVNTLLANKVDGIIASVTFETNEFSHLKKIIDFNIPLVLFSRYSSTLNCPKIGVTDYSGSYTAVEHLIKKGYRKIGYIGGPEHITLCQQRYSGYLKALKDNKLATKKNWIIQKKDVLENSVEYVTEFLTQKNRPDAVFAFADPVAITIVEVAKQLGINIPGDFGVIGFSDDPISKHISPSISTIRQPYSLIAEKIVESVLDLIQNGYQNNKYQAYLLDCHLVERESTQHACDKPA